MRTLKTYTRTFHETLEPFSADVFVEARVVGSSQEGNMLVGDPVWLERAHAAR